MQIFKESSQKASSKLRGRHTTVAMILICLFIFFNLSSTLESLDYCWCCNCLPIQNFLWRSTCGRQTEEKTRVLPICKACICLSTFRVGRLLLPEYENMLTLHVRSIANVAIVFLKTFFQTRYLYIVFSCFFFQRIR